jgi:hypothetical protein
MPVCRKIERNSKFLGRKAHILDQLHVMVHIKVFTGFFKKIKISAQNSKGLAFGFTQK